MNSFSLISTECVSDQKPLCLSSYIRPDPLEKINSKAVKFQPVPGNSPAVASKASQFGSLLPHAG
jgi:hypothetical protein